MFTKEQLAKWRELGFEFDDFYDSVAVDKKKEDYGGIDIPTISFKGKAPEKIEINKKTLIEFLISGESRYLKNNINVELISTDDNISFTTKQWRGDYGFTLKTNVTAKKEGAYVLQFKINGKNSNALNLTFYDKNQSENSSKCICKKVSWTADNLKYVVSQLRKLDIRKIDSNPKDSRGNKTYLDKSGNVIPSTDRGKRPKEAVKLNIIIKDLSFFDDIAEDNKENRDRLFLKKVSDLNIKASEANYNDFVKQLNRVFTKYEINTCLRKVHFFAQVYHETLKFTSTYENTSNTGYSGGDFYQGRGIKQITHDYNYLEYYSFVNKVKLFDIYMKNRIVGESVVAFNTRTNNQYISVEDMKKINELVSKVSTDIYYACDSAGWYWQKNKINQYADKDDIIGVSAKVNNPSATNTTSTSRINGFEERKKFYDLMKIILDYENCSS